VRAQIDRDLTTVDYFDRLLGLIKNLGHHKHNDQYMLDLENQVEAVAAPPPDPEEEEDTEDFQGESGVETGPASPYVNLG
jgi:hypothetical protein